MQEQILRIFITDTDNEERIEYLKNLFLNNHRNIEIVTADTDHYEVNRTDTSHILNVLIVKNTRDGVSTMLTVAESLGMENISLLVRNTEVGEKASSIAELEEMVRYSNRELQNIEFFECLWNKSDCNNRLFRRLKTIARIWFDK